MDGVLGPKADTGLENDTAMGKGVPCAAVGLRRCVRELRTQRARGPPERVRGNRQRPQRAAVFGFPVRNRERLGAGIRIDPRDPVGGGKTNAFTIAPGAPAAPTAAAPAHQPVAVRQHRHMAPCKTEPVAGVAECVVAHKDRFAVFWVQRVFQRAAIHFPLAAKRFSGVRVGHAGDAVVEQQQARQRQAWWRRQELRRVLAAEFAFRVTDDGEWRGAKTASGPVI